MIWHASTHRNCSLTQGCAVFRACTCSNIKAYTHACLQVAFFHATYVCDCRGIQAQPDPSCVHDCVIVCVHISVRTCVRVFVCICALVKHTVDSNFSHECKIQSHHVCADQYAAGECVSVCVCKCMCAHTLSRKRECANGGCHNVCVCVCLSILLCICVVCISLSRFGTLRMPPLSPSLSLSRS